MTNFLKICWKNIVATFAPSLVVEVIWEFSAPQLWNENRKWWFEIFTDHCLQKIFEHFSDLLRNPTYHQGCRMMILILGESSKTRCNSWPRAGIAAHAAMCTSPEGPSSPKRTSLPSCQNIFHEDIPDSPYIPSFSNHYHLQSELAVLLTTTVTASASYRIEEPINPENGRDREK